MPDREPTPQERAAFLATLQQQHQLGGARGVVPEMTLGAAAGKALKLPGVVSMLLKEWNDAYGQKSREKYGADNTVSLIADMPGDKKSGLMMLSKPGANKLRQAFWKHLKLDPDTVKIKRYQREPDIPISRGQRNQVYFKMGDENKIHDGYYKATSNMGSSPEGGSFAVTEKPTFPGTTIYLPAGELAKATTLRRLLGSSVMRNRNRPYSQLETLKFSDFDKFLKAMQKITGESKNKIKKLFDRGIPDHWAVNDFIIGNVLKKAGISRVVRNQEGMGAADYVRVGPGNYSIVDSLLAQSKYRKHIEKELAKGRLLPSDPKTKLLEGWTKAPVRKPKTRIADQ